MYYYQIFLRPLCIKQILLKKKGFICDNFVTGVQELVRVVECVTLQNAHSPWTFSWWISLLTIRGVEGLMVNPTTVKFTTNPAIFEKLLVFSLSSYHLNTNRNAAQALHLNVIYTAVLHNNYFLNFFFSQRLEVN